MRYLILAVMLSVAGIVVAQNTTKINGKVMSEQNQTIEFATVRINGNSTYVNKAGQFEIDVPSNETYVVEVFHLGFKDYNFQYTSTEIQSNLIIKLEPAPIHLNEIIVSKQRNQSTPQSNIIFDQEKKSTHAHDFGDWLKEVPGFGMVKRGGYALDPVFRSFKYEQLNLISNGVVQNTHACPNRMDPASTHVSVEEIKKLELIRGPFSVRYGPTMGGILNVVTDNSFQSTNQGISGLMETSYETNGEGKTARASLSHTSKYFHNTLSGGIKDFGNYKNGAGDEIPTSFKNYDYSLKSAYQRNRNELLSLNWHQNFSRDILHAGLPMDSDSDNSTTLSLNYSMSNISDKLYRFNASAYGSYVAHVMSNTFRPNFGAMEAVAEVDGITYGGKAEFNLVPSKNVVLFTGIDYRHVNRTGDRNRTVKKNMQTGETLAIPKLFTDAIWQDAQIDNLGAFVESRFLLSAMTSILTGLRVDYVVSDIRAPAEDFEFKYENLGMSNDVNLSLNASIAQNLGNNWQMQFAIGRGVRSANMIERYINHFTVGVDGYEYLGNPNLNPEANQQLELSIAKENKRFSLDASIYYSYITDFITAEVDSTINRKFNPMAEPRFTKVFSNVDASQYGYELSASYMLIPRLSVMGSLSQVVAENLSWEEPLAEIPPLEAIIGLNYKHDKWWLDTRARIVDTQDNVSTSFGESETDGFYTIDLRAGVELFKGFTLGASILNILDENYFEHLNRSYANSTQSGEIYEPGRNISVLLKYKF